MSLTARGQFGNALIFQGQNGKTIVRRHFRLKRMRPSRVVALDSTVPFGYGASVLGLSFYGGNAENSGSGDESSPAYGRRYATAAQELQRQKYREGRAAWKALDTAQKAAYNALQYPPRMSGYNRFMREWMSGTA